ncbi:GNAT family N-acetyltransferase [Pararcticibacter amylolyticus]|uniref:N-acetyltransferase n=1 Tax=Pararcticibacter amylolyticus TaxID=2173175 RepID=A0A2U2PK71_9SPHI|nr:GNAT family N-acetyltransferase [Pararcticibacter amylolyticus]PWG81803.1 N-acetyltransferase [Pararcticibacter amylolyticus]
MNYKDLSVTNNEQEQRYEFIVDNQISFIDYEKKGDKIFLTHTEVPEELEGKGVASAMVEKTFMEIEGQGLKVVPYCSYVRVFLKRHPEWNRLIVAAD